ncbi:MAG TPA: GAF domain-containing protein [Spirochaetota bacterium]|nr:GAF domain-containing protein [Spirochaetota bacterium]
MEKKVFQEKFLELISIMKEKVGIKNAIIRELDGALLITKGYFGYGFEAAHIKIEVGYGVTGLCALKKETIVINDLSTYSGEYIKGIDDAKSEICLPIFKNNKLVGTLNIESESKNNFTNDKVEFLEYMSSVISGVFGEDNTNKSATMNLAKTLAILENLK